MGGEPLSTAVHVFHGPLEAFKYITNAMHGVYEIMDYTLAWQCGNCYGEQPTSYVRSAFDKSSISPERALLVDEQCGTQRTLLHAVAANLADSVIVPFDAGDTLHILKLLLDVHVDLHPRDKYGATPLDYLCYGTHHFVGTINEEKYELAVHQWLQMLHSRGLDLHEYAKQEARLHPNGNLIHCRQIRKGVRRKILFRYGDMSDNLEISVKDKREDAPLEELIPGSWPDVDNDGRDIIDHSETTPGWDLVFEPLVSGGVE
ncbi:uncharacterized protein LDX57_003197 [Aspergillus melleus]|uniref:uncharacterized protein n=1 Tax=Aspergillus melleus TaxID=138277 RepID=UPI001E8DAE15|nr:uncharacterized protein LDX57_003197 [Aspergillus melleus]KAH8425444.1 hypothetical protein LDX57_003197 [Aspergillus melleus]